MPLPTGLIEKLIFMRFRNSNRFTQDSPVYPDVWMRYFEIEGSLEEKRIDLILTPHKDSSAAELFMLLDQRRKKLEPAANRGNWQMASSGESVVACLTFNELIVIALPLTKWWYNYLWKDKEPTDDQWWLIELAGAILYHSKPSRSRKTLSEDQLRQRFRALFTEHFGQLTIPKEHTVALWSVSRNRRASVSIERSVPSTKADAGRRLFDIDGSSIAWAIVDTGIDARHLAFRKKDTKTGLPFPEAMGAVKDKLSNKTRVIASYDFTRFREILVSIHTKKGKLNKKSDINCTGNNDDMSLTDVEVNNYITEIEGDLTTGRMLDWTVISPLLRIPHNVDEYSPPHHPHGTHVAGILGGGMDNIKGKLIGMCPCIDLYDIRVMDGSGTGQEFNILAAMQFLRWLNRQKDGLIIHGVNLSFSMIHEVDSYACGQTPVCLASEGLVSDGMVVVAAAGNLGQAMYQSTAGNVEQGFRMVNITDPGNAEDVITVGSTHRNRPHSYGVSYFSSKGPTGDGRYKPDLVAPGEKIVSAAIINRGVDDKTERMDGTSMAAPHVSGAAALLLARNRELIGRPRKVKEILCKTATDLGRERYFQGCGMVDVLRAIQSV